MTKGRSTPWEATAPTIARAVMVEAAIAELGTQGMLDKSVSFLRALLIKVANREFNFEFEGQ
jgi:hypothetical protein